MNAAPWHVIILIPARNEESMLPRCLASVKRSCTNLPPNVTFDIVVAVDSSSDLTEEIATQALAGFGSVVRTDAGVVGEARAIAARVALSRYTGPLHRCWVANTDADCCVPERWLVDQLALAMTGAEAIAGIIDVDSFAEHGPEVEMRFRSSYIFHPDGTHPHVHGANMGVRADAYLLAGGWSDLATAEDHDLWNRLLKVGSRRVSDVRMQVTTSGRRVGRAPLGFAGALEAHNEVAA